VAVLTVQQITGSGLAPAFSAASGGGDEVPCGETTFLVVKNGGGSPITVTVDSAKPCNYGADHDLSVAVPAGAERWIGPLPGPRFANASGRAQVTYSAVTSVTVGAFRV
jgi:hypothetical protein